MIKNHAEALRCWLVPRSICWLRAAGEPADEAGEDQLIEFAQSLDWIVLGDLDPTIRRLYAIEHDDRDPAVRLA